jgi:hypothetical protein
MFTVDETTKSHRPTPAWSCPREGCDNPLTDGQIVCTADIHMLASMCRGKKRLGRPEADSIEGKGRGVAYDCSLCREWHNGGSIRRRMELMVDTRAVVRALRADPWVGPRGLLSLADAWHPDRVNRSRWAEGIDQREALAAP